MKYFSVLKLQFTAAHLFLLLILLVVLPLQPFGAGNYRLGLFLAEQIVSALFVRFAKYRHGAQSQHHTDADEDLGVGTSGDLVDCACGVVRRNGIGKDESVVEMKM